MANIIIGKVAPVFRGAYSSTTTYNRLDIVEHGGSSYACLIDNTKGIAVTNTSRWVLVASKGDIGSVDYNLGNKTYNNF